MKINMFLNILISFLFLSSSSCKKEEPKRKPIPPVVKSPVVWSYDTKLTGLATNNFIYKNMIIQGHEISGSKMKVFALSLDSGKIAWETGVLDISYPFNAETSLLVGNKLIYVRSDKLIVLNADNGEVLWDKTLPTKNTERISHKGNFVFISTSAFSEPSAHIFKFDLNSGELSTIISLPNDDEGFRLKFTAPNFWKHPNGDEIFVLASQSFNGSFGNVERYDFLAYNISADSILWYKKGKRGIRGSILSPFVHNNLAVFYVANSVDAVDLLTGDSVWVHERHPSDDFSSYKSANITAWNNILIAKPDSWHMYGLDINTGQEIWVNPKTTTMPFATRIAMDKIWIGSGGVCCYDAKTGSTLIDSWRYQNKGSWINSIAVDESTGLIYTMADGVIYCLDSKILMGK